MKAKLGILCILLGIGMLAGSLWLYLNNETEANVAGRASRELLPQLIEAIRQEELRHEEILRGEQSAQTEETQPVDIWDPSAVVMTEVEIDGHAYIGVISIPALEIELPVMSGWSYKKLKIAPCRYSGTVKGNDLVIMAHNYERHFGHIAQLSVGDTVQFADMDSIVTNYEVVALDILPPSAVEEMTAGNYDLTLFTCTYGGQNRVTVYCDRVKKS